MPSEGSTWLERLRYTAERLHSPLAIVGLVLLGIYAVVSNLMGRVQFGQLTPQSTYGVINTILHNIFVIALVTIVLSMLAYVLPKILPKSVFMPAPRLDYGVAIFKLFDPGQNHLSQILQSVELFPGFPFYSRESDHPSAWPPRVFTDREVLYASYVEFFNNPDVRGLIRADTTFQADSITLLRSGPQAPAAERELANFIANASHHLRRVYGKDPKALTTLLGDQTAQGFLEIEQRRADLRQWFPNRLAIVRVRNIGRRDILNLGLELEIAGYVYDCVIEADPDKVRKSAWDGDAQRVSFERLPSGYTAEVRLWYQYQSLSERVFPDKIDVINELTQGVKITNIAASRTVVRYNAALLKDLQGYERLYTGDARKKDKYDAELVAFHERAAEQMQEEMHQYEEQHGSYNDIDIAQLAALDIPDARVENVWLVFRSPANCNYTAVHVFTHSNGPYILLSSKDKDEQDLLAVRDQIVKYYAGTTEDRITDRSDDLCTTIEVDGGFTQQGIADCAATLAAAGYHDLKVSKFHYSKI